MWFIITKESAFLIVSICYFSIFGVCIVELFLLIYSILFMIARFWEFYCANFIFYKFSIELLALPKFLELYWRVSSGNFTPKGITGFLS